MIRKKINFSSRFNRSAIFKCTKIEKTSVLDRRHEKKLSQIEEEKSMLYGDFKSDVYFDTMKIGLVEIFNSLHQIQF